MHVPKTINFITTNKGKVSTFQNKLGEDFIVKQTNLNIIEPQADSVEEIVSIKASSAYSQLKQSIVVQDTGFIIPDLNNFPGPYIKYILDSIGIEGILNLMKDKEDRSCYFIGSSCYQDKDGQKIFTNQGKAGSITSEIRGELPENAWSPLWQIVIPSWSNGLTYAEIGADGMKNRESTSKGKSDIEQLANFLKYL